MNNNSADDLLTLPECAKYGHVKRQAVFVAIKKGRLVAKKVSGRWIIKRGDYDEYRAEKYNRSVRKIGDEYVFDIEKGHLSVQQVAKVFSVTLGSHYPIHRIYYLVRTGQIRAFKKGTAWVIDKEDAIALLEREMVSDKKQFNQA